MAAITLADGIVLDINPIFQKKFEFIKVKITEAILGDLPDIELQVKCDEDITKVLEEITGKLTNADGFTIDFVGYVYSISYVNDVCTIKILGVKPSFVRVLNTTKFTSLPNAIKGLYPGKIESNTESDLLNEINIFQMNETNYHLCKKCALAYKKDTVYGFALGSLRFHDLNNWVSKFKLAAKIDLNQLTSPELTNPKLYEQKTKIVDYSSGNDPNHKYVRFYDKLIPLNNEYVDLIGNYIYNQKFSTMKNIANYDLRELPPLQLTDGVEIVNIDATIKRCFITNKVSDMDFNRVIISYTIQSIDPL